jgi:hypothetical protein
MDRFVDAGLRGNHRVKIRLYTQPNEIEIELQSSAPTLKYSKLRKAMHTRLIEDIAPVDKSADGCGF